MIINQNAMLRTFQHLFSIVLSDKLDNDLRNDLLQSQWQSDIYQNLQEFEVENF